MQYAQTTKFGFLRKLQRCSRNGNSVLKSPEIQSDFVGDWGQKAKHDLCQDSTAQLAVHLGELAAALSTPLPLHGSLMHLWLSSHVQVSN